MDQNLTLNPENFGNNVKIDRGEWYKKANTAWLVFPTIISTIYVTAFSHRKYLPPFRQIDVPVSSY